MSKVQFRWSVVGAACVAGTLLFSTPASSQTGDVTVSTLLEWLDDKESDVFVWTTVNALHNANRVMKYQTGKSLYCLPPQLGMSVELAKQILREHVAKHPQGIDGSKKDNVPIFFIRAFQILYPCKE